MSPSAPHRGDVLYGSPGVIGGGAGSAHYQGSTTVSGFGGDGTVLSPLPAEMSTNPVPDQGADLHGVPSSVLRRISTLKEFDAFCWSLYNYTSYYYLKWTALLLKHEDENYVMPVWSNANSRERILGNDVGDKFYAVFLAVHHSLEIDPPVVSVDEKRLQYWVDQEPNNWVLRPDWFGETLKELFHEWLVTTKPWNTTIYARKQRPRQPHPLWEHHISKFQPNNVNAVTLSMKNALQHFIVANLIVANLLWLQNNKKLGLPQ